MQISTLMITSCC